MKKSLLVMTLVAVVLPQNGFGTGYEHAQAPESSVDHALLVQAGFNPLITAIILGKVPLALDMITLGDESLLNERTKSGVSAFSFAVYKSIDYFSVANGLLDKGVKVGIKDMDWIIRNFDLKDPEIRTTYDPLYHFHCFAEILRRLYEADPSMMEPYLEGKTSFTPWNDWINTTCRWYGPEEKNTARGINIMSLDSRLCTVFQGLRPSRPVKKKRSVIWSS